MINLKTKTASPKYFESSEISHPEQTGTNFVEYTVTHNFGLEPDLTRMYRLVNGTWREATDFFVNPSGPTNQGYSVTTAGTVGPNETKVRVYRLTVGTFTIKFRMFYI